jgi:hypothetical protein
MHTETDYLKILAVEIAAKTKIESEDNLPDKHLLAEASRLQKLITGHLLAIDNFPQRESFYFNTLRKLVDICDILYEGSNIITPDVNVLLDLITEIKKVLPTEISPGLNLSKAFIHLQKEKLVKICNEHQQILKDQQVDPKLIVLATIPFRHFINAKHKLCWRNFTWLKGFEKQLENIDWENADCNSKTEALMSLLINCDFNDDRFFIYCKRYIKQRVGIIINKNRQLSAYAECEKLILEDTYHEFHSYNHHRKNISDKLIDWIRKETNAIRLNERLEDDIYKIEFNLDVDSIALFWKHLMDHGVTKLANVDLYAKQIAATCSSKGKGEFKWETIKGKFYGKNPKYLKRIFDPLVAIIEDIKRFLKT